MSSDSKEQEEVNSGAVATPSVAEDADGEQAEEGSDSNSMASDVTKFEEPLCDKANTLPFSILCRRLEALWRQRKGDPKRKKVSDEEKKKLLLPPPMLHKMEGESIYPLLRLLLPDKDSARRLNIKEKLIAQVYCDAVGLAKGTKSYDALYCFTDPTKTPNPSMAGDLSQVVEAVLLERIPNRPSNVNLGQLNQILDDLAGLKNAQRSSHQHEWRESDSKSARRPKKKKKAKLNNLREHWLRKAINKGLSPLEHKWLVRIILQKMEFGLGWRSILHWYSPYAIELWNSHNSLKNMCDQLALGYTEKREQEDLFKEDMEQEKAGNWQPQAQPAALGNTLSPMLSVRARFADCMHRVQANHQDYLKTSGSPPYLTLKFPPLCLEIKLDGERMVVHVNKGEVTMLTRNGKWYSQLYSPAIGPALRKSLSKYHVNCILDGEMESWDNGRKQLIPFGNNRTVANYRKLYMRRHNLLDERDLNLHEGQTEAPVMRAAEEFKWVNQNFHAGQDPGKDCWLQYIIFDLLYVDGPDVNQLFEDCGIQDVEAGSIIHLSCMDRKRIMYQLIKEQPNEIEIAQAVVLRPNGDCVRGEDYFSSHKPLMECGYPVTLLDSTHATIEGKIPNIEDLDKNRSMGRKDLDISRRRSQSVDAFYRKVVEVHRFEGLVLKDLASPYILGEGSRKRKYWHKFKPDYEKEGVADLDVLVLGAYFATGLRHSGKLSHFLCGCLDSEDPSTYMTLCNVNGGSVTNHELHQIMKATDFKAASGEEETVLGKWFIEENHGENIPNFISLRSLQRGGKEDYEGWKFNRNKNYPDVWIHPEDSVVLSIQGQEFVESEEYSAGVSLRFARINRVRHDTVGDPKAPSEVADDKCIWEKYLENIRERQLSASNTGSVFSPTKDGGDQPATVTRFLTPEEYTRTNKRKRTRTREIMPSKIPKVDTLVSDTLKGLNFVCLEGNYGMQSGSAEAQEAKEEGWFASAIEVQQKEDVMKFILSHGGSIKISTESGNCFILGGRADDARVTNYIKGIQFARDQRVEDPKTKKAKLFSEIAKNSGVLKWTFVFSLVFRWRSPTGDISIGSRTEPIQKSDPQFLTPNPHHYLTRITDDD